METELKLEEVAKTLEDQMKDAPEIKEEVGVVSQEKNPETLKKMSYYVIFAPKDQTVDATGSSLKAVHVARFESKRDIRNVIKKLEEQGFKLVDLIKGRPLSFVINKRTISEIEIGD